MATDSHFLDSAVYSTASCFAAASRSARAQLTLRVGRASSPKIPSCLAPAASLLSSTWAAVSRWSIFQTSPAAVARMSAEMAIDVFIGGSIEAFHVFRAAAFVIRVPRQTEIRRHRTIPSGPIGGRVNEAGVSGDESMEPRFTLLAQPLGKKLWIGWRGFFHILKKECHATRGSGQKTSE